MKHLPVPLRALVFVLVAVLASTPSAAHGGSYQGPATTGSRAGGGGGLAPSGLGALGAAGAAARPGTMATMPPGGAPSLDLTQWGSWWQQNQAPYLALKEHIHSTGVGTGSDGWFLGDGQKRQQATLRPAEEQIRAEVVPALLAVLERETNNDLVTGALVALAKIGDTAPAATDGETASGARAAGARLETVFTRFLRDPSQEVRETAAISLGILASPRSIPPLAHLLWDTDAGRTLAGANEVDYRTRSFAAYGLGLVGARATSEVDRQTIVSILRRAIEEDDTRSRDLEVACVIALGLVPLATIEPPPPAAGERRARPERARLAQLDYLFALLDDEKRENLTRAHCPGALARLLEGLPEPHRAQYRAQIANDLIERIERERDRNEVVQSCVLALGAIGTSDGADPLDERIRRTLANVPRLVSDSQTRAFALMAAAAVGGRPGVDPQGRGIEPMRVFLMEQMFEGKNALQPWAALGAGVLCRELETRGSAHPALESMRRALRFALDDERSPEQVGAYALAVGLARGSASAPRLMKLLEKGLDDETRGQVAIGLALLGHEPAIEPLRKIVAESKYRPELLRQGAIALGILGDKTIAPELAVMLKDARSLAGQAAIASALGFIGDRRSVEPLLKLLRSEVATERARAFAAVALGNVADKELLPWNSKIGLGINYRAATATLTDPMSGTGILDIL